MEPVKLLTKRLRLMGVTPALIREIFTTKSEPDIRAFFNLDDSGWERMRAMHHQGMETHRMSLYYFLLQELSSGRIIGECGFHSWNRTHCRAELFYALKLDSDKRKGFISEALTPILNFGFSIMELHRIEALTARWNEASMAVLRKFDFRHEGVRREDFLMDGRFEDSELFSLLSQEWKFRA